METSSQIILAKIALGIGFFGLASTFYFLVGFIAPDATFRIERMVRKLLERPSVLILDYDSYIRKRNIYLVFLITSACTTALSVLSFILISMGGE